MHRRGIDAFLFVVISVKSAGLVSVIIGGASDREILPETIQFVATPPPVSPRIAIHSMDLRE